MNHCKTPVGAPVLLLFLRYVDMKSYLRLQTLTVVVLIVVSLIGVSCSRMMGSAVLQLELGGNQTYGFYRGIFQQLTTCSLSILQAIGIISPDEFGWISCVKHSLVFVFYMH